MSEQTNHLNRTTTLNRTITLWPLVLFGIAYIAPFIVLITFGIFSEASHGTLPTSYALSTVAMIFTAFSYGKLAKLYPVSGSAYSYARHAIGSRVGFMVGWAVMLDYFFLPMVVWLIGVSYLTGQFPSVPKVAWLLSFIILTTALNVIGIKVATRANLVLIAYQMLILVIFVTLAIHSVAERSGAGGLISTTPFWNNASTIGAVSAGAALTAYSFIGFDAVSTFAEEVVEPRKTVPRAIVMTALLAGVLFVIVAYFTQLQHAGGHFANPGNAAEAIAKEIGGDFFGAVFLATVILAQFTAGVPIQAAGARLMYAMGRDNALPQKIFGWLHPRFHTPAINLVLTGLVGLIALKLSVATSTSFINFGAFTAFAFVNISVVTTYARDRQMMRRNALAWVVMPIIGLGVIVWLMTHLDWKALALGGAWVVVGFCWLLWLTRGFRIPPPEMAAIEDDEDLDEVEHRNLIGGDQA